MLLGALHFHCLVERARRLRQRETHRFEQRMVFGNLGSSGLVPSLSKYARCQKISVLLLIN